jgi:hypothetical protein
MIRFLFSRHCESSEAIQPSYWIAASGVTLLAMTFLFGGAAEARTYSSVPGEGLVIDEPTGKTYSTDRSAAPVYEDTPAQKVERSCAAIKKSMVPADLPKEEGESIEGADLNETPEALPEVITIPLTYDMVEAFNIDVPDGMKMESNMAVIQIKGDGTVVYNGTDLTSKINTVCGETVE